MIISSNNNNNNNIILLYYLLVCYCYSNLITINAFPLFLIPNEQNLKTTKNTLSSPSDIIINNAEAQFMNPKHSITIIEGIFKFKAIKNTNTLINTGHESDENNRNCNKTLITGQINTGIFDKISANYMIQIVDRSKNLIYDLTSNKPFINNNLIVEVPKIKYFEYTFNVKIDKIVDELLQISHRTKGIIGVAVIKKTN
ncbi:hypothetical protein Glove_166g155 [Diversispora epigaea]|uniref:Uncharacterized protein n=1 Tax=Diversispora epigaea TaxID=1348612 RepID=A0A397IQJ5_9GLOM|nr:hypothetical protein Glove_166g155 [Diversispora epigaea]